MSTSQIKEGSKFINDKLKDKGYFSSSDKLEKLLFNSIDLKTLKESKEEEDEGNVVTPTMLENDKHLINVIYELLHSQERGKSVSESSILRHQQQQTEIMRLQRKIESLTGRLDSQDQKLHEKDVEIRSLSQELKTVQIEKVQIKRERNVLKTLNESLKEKQKMELKRKNIEIDELRDKLIIKLNSISATSSVPLSQQPASSAPAATQDSRLLVAEIIDTQTQKLLENSSNLIYDLILSNEINAGFLMELNNYFSTLNNKASGVYAGNLLLKAPNFKDFIAELNKKLSSVKINEDLNVAVRNISNFNDIRAAFIRNLSKFDEDVSNLISSIKKSDNAETEHTKLDSLLKEIEDLKKNWIKANENAENWKNLYRQSVPSSE